MAGTEIKKGLLVVSGGILQTFALKRARELGVETYLVDGSEHCAARDLADHFYLISTRDADGIATLAKDLASQGKIQGVYTQGADVEHIVALAARAAGLPGIDPESAFNCNNKVRTRRLLTEHGVSKVPFVVVEKLADADALVARVGYPCYVKPIDNSASRGMTRLTSSAGLSKAIEDALNACFIEKAVLVEKEITGIEYSVDTILYNGVLYPAGISDRVFQTKESYAVQSGSRTPSLLPVATQDEMYRKMRDAAKAVGISDGAFKGDLIVRDDTGEVEIIEITARTSGGHDSQLRKPLSFGIDLMKATMDIALGQPLDPLDLIPRWVKWSSTFAIFPEPGIVKKISGLDEALALPGVADITLLVKEGDMVKPYIHSATRTNFITCVADTYEQLLALEDKIRDTLHIETIPA